MNYEYRSLSDNDNENRKSRDGLPLEDTENHNHNHKLNQLTQRVTSGLQNAVLESVICRRQDLKTNNSVV